VVTNVIFHPNTYFSSKSGEFLKGTKTLMAEKIQKNKNIVLDSLFWEKKKLIGDLSPKIKGLEHPS
jgi:hypothetical protein